MRTKRYGHPVEQEHDVIRPLEPLADFVRSDHFRARQRELAALKVLDTSAYNELAEQMFYELARSGEGLPVRVWIGDCAFALGCSVETVKRYVQKYSGTLGFLSLVDGKVAVRKDVQNGMV